MKVIYILGSSRSGSSLLARLLAENVPSENVGEIMLIGERGIEANWLCGCGARFAECEYWGCVLSHLKDRASEDSTDRLVSGYRRVARMRYVVPLTLKKLRTAQFQQDLEAYEGTLTELYRCCALGSQSEVIIDASKSPLYAQILANISDIELHCVHLIRDPRAVAYSAARKKIRSDTPWEESHMRETGLFLMSCLWAAENILSPIIARKAASYTRVFYDELVSNPGNTIACLHDRTGENLSSYNRIRFGVDEFTINHSISGNSNRFGPKLIEIRADSEWRSGMHWLTQSLVMLITLPTRIFLYFFRSKETVKNEKAGADRP